MLPHPDRVYYDSSVEKKQSCACLSDFDKPDVEKKNPISFHAVTGNYYISAFFGKGKGKCWKLMKTREECFRIQDDWVKLGADRRLDEHNGDVFLQSLLQQKVQSE